MGRIRNLWVLFGLLLFTVSIYDFHVSADVIPSENECRPYIEKAIHELKNVEATGTDDKETTEESLEKTESIETEAVPGDDGNDSGEDDADKSAEKDDGEAASQETQTEENLTVEDNKADDSKEEAADDKSVEDGDDKDEKSAEHEDDKDEKSAEQDDDSEQKPDEDNDSKEKADTEEDSKENADEDGDSKEGETQGDDGADSKENAPEDGTDSKEDDESGQTDDKHDSAEQTDEAASEQANDDSKEDKDDDNQTGEDKDDSKEDEPQAEGDADGDSKEDSKENDEQTETAEEESVEETVRAKRSIPDGAEDGQSDEQQESAQDDDKDSQETANELEDKDSKEEAQDDDNDTKEDTEDSKEAADDDDNEESDEDDEPQEDATVEDLTMEFEIPKNLRPHDHVTELLGLDEESSIKEHALRRTGDVILKDLKRIYDNAVKPLETMYKYRDLSNRHFGDPEIFSKPLVLFMGPWSGGKSTILNYLTDNEYTPNSIRSGAEPSPAYFNILMHGDEPEVLDGTQLAADWTFSGLQKFGQGLMDRLRGQKLPNTLLERVNIVEIPGILEVRKQVSRYFPFNDACQWFIDRADIIFLVYDPSKLDVGPETEAILDQLKGREYQTRILLNKADQVKPEELLRVQSALIWNISPLMSSAQPPVMYTVSLWSHPYENGAPIRLLQAQERAFLSDLREAIDKRIENKIASARRFAVRIRNHAKMVDCYLTTYYNQKGLFSNKKQVADKIIEHPQTYNIYEGLSTLTNISRYDLPDPEVYLDFFRLNPLYEFKKLSETCTYFKGCPINKLDIAIAYELPELVGKYKKLFEQSLNELRKQYDENCNQTEPEPPVKIIKSR